jgi:hypothetical protein
MRTAAPTPPNSATLSKSKPLPVKPSKSAMEVHCMIERLARARDQTGVRRFHSEPLPLGVAEA